jgi:cell division protein FtsQ
MIADGVLGRSLRSLRAGSRGVAAGRTRSRTRRRPSRVRRIWLVGVVAGLAALAAGGWLWLRESGLVAVQRVTVTGLSGPDAGQIRASLVAAARGMTTMDVHLATLRAAVSPYPVVAGLRVSTEFPHGMRISVIERLPVATVAMGGQTVPVAADGTLLRDVAAGGRLPALTLRAAPGGPRVTDSGSIAALRALAAAPADLRERISTAGSDYWHGVVLQLRQGPVVYFGGASRITAKWQAIDALLAAPADAGASYLDVTDPARPAAGVGGTEASLASALGLGAAVTSSAGTTSGSAAGSSSSGSTPAGG